MKPPPNQLAAHKFCIDRVRKGDRENYLAALCIDSVTLRRIVFALRALNVELATVRDSTSDPNRAKIRFHFWSKLVEEIVRQNSEPEPNIDKSIAYYKHSPIAKELLDLFYLVDVDNDIRGHLDDLIGARVSSKAMGSKLFQTTDELELYCSKSNSSLYHLCWKLAQNIQSVWPSDRDIVPTVSATSESLGIAHGLSNIIRGIQYSAYNEICYIPVDMMEKHELRTRDFVGRQLNGERIAPLVQSLAVRCQGHLDGVHGNLVSMPVHLSQLFLPRVSIQSNLRQLKKCNYNICDSSLRRRNELLPFSLWLVSKFPKAPVTAMRYVLR